MKMILKSEKKNTKPNQADGWAKTIDSHRRERRTLNLKTKLMRERQRDRERILLRYRRKEIGRDGKGEKKLGGEKKKKEKKRREKPNHRTELAPLSTRVFLCWKEI